MYPVIIKDFTKDIGEQLDGRDAWDKACLKVCRATMPSTGVPFQDPPFVPLHGSSLDPVLLEFYVGFILWA
jgi:hypothetical protein